MHKIKQQKSDVKNFRISCDTFPPVITQSKFPLNVKFKSKMRHLVTNSKYLPQIVARFYHHQSYHCQKYFKPILRKQILNTLPTNRYFQTTLKNYAMPKTPELIYMPHLVRWVKSKLRFKYLKKIWDPEFSEGAFIYGSTQAICRITQIISQGRTEELDGLMTVAARNRFQDEMKYRITQQQRELIMLQPDNIKILVPTNVALIKEGIRKFCIVALRVLALKWHPTNADQWKLVLVALQCEFIRDYGDHASEEWTISDFAILECSILQEAS